MSEITKDPNVLMKRWMQIYINLNVMLSTDPVVSLRLAEMKEKLAEANERVMVFFDLVGADPEADV